MTDRICDPIGRLVAWFVFEVLDRAICWSTHRHP